MSVEHMCTSCGRSFVRYNTMQKYCGVCAYNKYAKPRKPISKKGKVYTKWIETRHDWIQKNATRSGTWHCYICDKELTIDTLTLDHIQVEAADPI